MSVADLVAVVVVIVATAAATAALYASGRMLATARRLQRSADALDDAAAELLEELDRLSADARRALGRAEDQLERAGQVADAIEHASKATYRTVAGPVIKAAAVASGVRRGAERLRHGPDPEPPPRGVLGAGRGRSERPARAIDVPTQPAEPARRRFRR